ncbi:hypothetical protein ACP70R_003176 [Stipagrostis hirtigluma subsp. patula]
MVELAKYPPPAGPASSEDGGGSTAAGGGSGASGGGPGGDGELSRGGGHGGLGGGGERGLGGDGELGRGGGHGGLGDGGGRGLGGGDRAAADRAEAKKKRAGGLHLHQGEGPRASASRADGQGGRAAARADGAGGYREREEQERRRRGGHGCLSTHHEPVHMARLPLAAAVSLGLVLHQQHLPVQRRGAPRRAPVGGGAHGVRVPMTLSRPRRGRRRPRLRPGPLPRRLRAPDDCATHLQSAVLDVNGHCNAANRRAAIWYDTTSASSATYADTNASADDEDGFRQELYNHRNVSDDEAAFERTYVLRGHGPPRRARRQRLAAGGADVRRRGGRLRPDGGGVRPVPAGVGCRGATL